LHVLSCLPIASLFVGGLGCVSCALRVDCNTCWQSLHIIPSPDRSDAVLCKHFVMHNSCVLVLAPSGIFFQQPGTDLNVNKDGPVFDKPFTSMVYDECVPAIYWADGWWKKICSACCGLHACSLDEACSSPQSLPH